MKRSAGILMPIPSLPSPYGIGTMGREAREFITFLKESGQSYWQILPIGPTSYGDSPYQSFSSYAGNPYLIDLRDLEEEGLLKEEEFSGIHWEKDPERIDYGALYQNRFTVLRKASDRLQENRPVDYAAFLQANTEWLEDYALFMSLKGLFGGGPWMEWPEQIRRHEKNALLEAAESLQEEIRFWKNIQYLFFRQWNALKACAKENGIRIIGDLPIYVAQDSCDVWADQKYFRLDDRGQAAEISGCPPDGFSDIGQLWGNPLYQWDLLKEEGYHWWIRRITFQLKLVDVLRIDHFRGFESYFAIPNGEETARNGHWEKGPGREFFTSVEKSIGKVDIIAEDLGYLTPEVRQLLQDTGYPGMKVLEFAFDPREPGTGYLPHQFPRNCVAYTGTHDNDTVIGWFEHCPSEVTDFAKEYLHLDAVEGYHWGFIRAVYESVADLAVVPMQDVLGLGGEARINVPSTTGNWTWRAKDGSWTAEHAAKLRRMAEIYERIPE